MLFNIVLGFHLLLCVTLVTLVLLQQGKGADAGAALGGSSNSLFGATGANSLMVKVTTGAAVLFMITSLFLVRGYSALMDTDMTTPKVQIKDPGLGGAALPNDIHAEVPATQEAPKSVTPAAAPSEAPSNVTQPTDNVPGK